MGEADQGVKLLREAQPVAVRLPTTGWAVFARANLAEDWRDGPSRGLGTVEGNRKRPGARRYLGHIAHRLAGKDPAEAERVLMTMMRDQWPYYHDTYAQRVCYRMVTLDPERALRLAREITDYNDKARALGAMAMALAQSGKDRATAEALLDEAFGGLEKVASGNQDQWNGLSMACTAAAGLLPIVEQVNPCRVASACGGPWPCVRRYDQATRETESRSSPGPGWPPWWHATIARSLARFSTASSRRNCRSSPVLGQAATPHLPWSRCSGRRLLSLRITAAR